MEYRVTSRYEKVVAICHELSIARIVADSLGSNYRVVAWGCKAPNTPFDFPPIAPNQKLHIDGCTVNLHHRIDSIGARDDMRHMGITL